MPRRAKVPARKRARFSAGRSETCSKPAAFTLWRWKPSAASELQDDGVYSELYIEQRVGEARYAWCRLCGEPLAQQPWGIANFKRHLSNVHPMFLLEKDSGTLSYKADARPCATPSLSAPNTLFSSSVVTHDRGTGAQSGPILLSRLPAA